MRVTLQPTVKQWQRQQKASRPSKLQPQYAQCISVEYAYAREIISVSSMETSRLQGKIWSKSFMTHYNVCTLTATRSSLYTLVRISLSKHHSKHSNVLNSGIHISRLRSSMGVNHTTPIFFRRSNITTQT